MNSISQFFGGGPRLPSFFGNIMELVTKTTRFARNPIGEIMSMNNVNVPPNFRGSPEDLANYLMNSGQMRREDFQEFAQSANQLVNWLPKLWGR